MCADQGSRPCGAEEWLERGGSTRAEFPGSCQESPNLLSRIHPRAALPSSSPSSCVDVRSRRSARLSRELVRQSETRQPGKGGFGGTAAQAGEGLRGGWKQRTGEEGREDTGARGLPEMGEAREKGSLGDRARFVHASLFHHAKLRAKTLPGIMARRPVASGRDRGCSQLPGA